MVKLAEEASRYQRYGLRRSRIERYSALRSVAHQDLYSREKSVQASQQAAVGVALFDRGHLCSSSILSLSCSSSVSGGFPSLPLLKDEDKLYSKLSGKFCVYLEHEIAQAGYFCK